MSEREREQVGESGKWKSEEFVLHRSRVEVHLQVGYEFHSIIQKRSFTSRWFVEMAGLWVIYDYEVTFKPFATN